MNSRTETVEKPMSLEEQRKYSEAPGTLRRILRERNAECEHPSGYWINEPDHFRCYTCGYQIYVDNLDNPDAERDIETWEAR